MTRVAEIDFGGKEVPWFNLIDEHTISYLSNLNRNLGTKDDEKYADFDDFIKEIEDQSVEIVSGSEIISSKDENIDIDNYNEVENPLNRNDFISCALNVAKAILGSKEKHQNVKDVLDNYDKTTGMSWNMGEANLSYLKDNYTVKKKKE